MRLLGTRVAAPSFPAARRLARAPIASAGSSTPSVCGELAAEGVWRDDLVKAVLPMFTAMRWSGPAQIDGQVDGETG